MKKIIIMLSVMTSGAIAMEAIQEGEQEKLMRVARFKECISATTDWSTLPDDLITKSEKNATLRIFKIKWLVDKTDQCCGVSQIITGGGLIGYSLLQEVNTGWKFTLMGIAACTTGFIAYKRSSKNLAEGQFAYERFKSIPVKEE